MKLLLLFPLFLFTTSKIIDTDYIADDTNLYSYFITYINDTKVVTPLSDISKKLR
jgi:hypothetical protein